MNYLIFCSFEVGGFPYKMAETLNRHGIMAYYISLTHSSNDHDSTEFHYGKRNEDWDLSSLFDRKHHNSGKDVKLLKYIESKYNIEDCFATGHKSYLLAKAGIEYKYWCYGSDLDQYCKFFVFPENFPIWKKLILSPYFLLTFCRMQKETIAHAKSLMISSYQLKDYKAICPKTQLFFLPHLIHIESYEALSIKKLEAKKKICELIKAERFFFSSTRHFWFGKNKAFSDYKGNDVILYSFMNYLKVSGDKSSKLILVKKGPDVENTELLIKKFNISDFVVLVDEMPRDELSVYYRGASICFGQFGTPALTYAALEPLSNATPCVSFIGDNDGDVPFYNAIPPIFNNRNPEDITSFMIKIMSDMNFSSNISRQSWAWAKENCSEEQFVKSFVKEMSS